MFVQYEHFKMESIHSILSIVTPGCWMASIDLKDAYYSVRVHYSHQKYLKFKYNGKLFKYTVFRNGLSSCPRKFTKILKPILSELHLANHIVCAYIDDLYLQSDSYAGCVKSVIDTISLLDWLGFIIHPQKSEYIPKQKIKFLGFIIDSVSMTVFLPETKKQNIKKHVSDVLLHTGSLQIEYVAKSIGYLVSSLPAVQYGALYYRWLAAEKTTALSLNKGNFKAYMLLSDKARLELKWWLDNIDASYNILSHPPINYVIYSDASSKGWGAAMNDSSSGGQWSPLEAKFHINYLELLAAFFALKCYLRKIANHHIKIMIDNSATVGIINNMGTCHSPDCHTITVKIWESCMQNKIQLTAAHLPGSTNIIADKESRNFSCHHTEWMLNSTTLSRALHTLNFTPEIDLFASRLNKQFDQFCSFKPEPDAFCIDSFSISWSNLRFYCFPPFSCVLKAVQKVKREKAIRILVVPKWPTQPWYPLLISLLVKPPVVLLPSPTHLSLPVYPKEKHPLHKKMTLLICLLSGKN